MVAAGGQAEGEFAVFGVGEGFVEAAVGQQDLAAEGGGVEVDEVNAWLAAQAVVFFFVFQLDEAGDEFALLAVVGAFDAGQVWVGQGGGDLGQPVGMGAAVGVGEAEDVAAGGADAQVAGGGGVSAAGLVDDLGGSGGGGGPAGAVGGAVIDDDDFVPGRGRVWRRRAWTQLVTLPAMLWAGTMTEMRGALAVGGWLPGAVMGRLACVAEGGVDDLGFQEARFGQGGGGPGRVALAV